MTRSALALLLAIGVVGAGCSLTRPALVKHSYLLEVERAPETAAPAIDGTLRVGMFPVAPPFAGKPMVYRFDEHRYDADFYNEYFVAPRDLVSQRVLEWMQTARVYRFTLPAGADGPRTTLLLSGLVTEMYGDVRDAAHPAAVLSIQFYVTRQGNNADSVLLGQKLRQVVPVADASPGALAIGLSTALRNILTEFERQVRTARPGDASEQ